MLSSTRGSQCSRSGQALAYLGLAIVLVTPGAWAQFDCLEYSPPVLFDTTNNPIASPNNPRSRGAEVFSWGGHQYLLHGTGNDLELFNADDPANPGSPRDSHFQVPPYGDRDYNLFNFSVCENCRFGAAGFDVQGLVLWDFGTGATPTFASSHRWVDSGSIGAFTFSYGGQQYLIARVSSQCQGNALVTFDGVNPGSLGLVQCITDAAGVPIPVDAGFWLDDTVPGDDVVGYVYLLDSSDRDVNMYSVRIQGGHPHLTPEGAVVKAVWILDHGFDLTAEVPQPWAPFAVSAYNDGLKVWDLSDPTAPYPIWTSTLPFMVAANSVEVQYPFVYVGSMHTVDTGSGHFYDISNPFALNEIDPTFWYSTQPWNGFNYMSNKGGAFTPDAQWLFLARYSVLERFAVDCFYLVPPLAQLSVTPSVPFPGDQVAVTNSTPANHYTQSAMWVSNAHGTIVAGSPVMSGTTPTTIHYTVPLTLLNSPYTMHLAVARAPEFPCTDPLNHPELCGAGQIANVQLDVDAQPEAVLETSPPTVITGDLLTLDGRASEGHPSSCSWDVRLDGSAPPVPPPTVCDPLAMVAQYQIPADAPGQWTFSLTTRYLHPGPLGGQWSDTASEVLDVSSVAAAFSIYPAQPISTADVILCSQSRAATSHLEYSWELSEEPDFTPLLTSSGTCSSGIPECGSSCGWVVDEAYFPDQTQLYYARLTVTNLDTGESSQATRSFVVTNSGVNPSFSWVPSSPSVGGTVYFVVSGVPAVDSTRWDFGLPGCPGYTQITTCTPQPPFIDCLDQVYKYGLTGTGVPVHLWVTLDGTERGPYVEYIDVGSGSCGGPSCTYSIQPTSASYGPAGGTGTISVDASDPSCGWIATTPLSWIHVTSGSSGLGDGTVSYDVDPFTGSVRAGNINVAGEAFLVQQSGGALFADGFESGTSSAWSVTVP